MHPDAMAFVAALPEHEAASRPRRPTVSVPIRRCLGVAQSPTGGADAYSLVLQKADGGLHVLTMDFSTAVAIALAIRSDIRL